MSGFATPGQANLADYTVFLRSIGLNAAVLPDDSMWIPITFEVAKATVNPLLALGGCGPTVPNFYVLALYNLGADRVINFAPDQPNQTFFSDLRSSLALNSFASGLVTASSDQSTSQTLETIEAAKKMTIGDLQLAKTPYGRLYLSLAQKYGPNIWGLS
jgi:hypothetical protein